MYTAYLKRFAFYAMLLFPGVALVSPAFVRSPSETRDALAQQCNKTPESLNAMLRARCCAQNTEPIFWETDGAFAHATNSDVCLETPGKIRLVGDFVAAGQGNTPNRIGINSVQSAYPTTGFAAGYVQHDSVELPAAEAVESRFRDLPTSQAVETAAVPINDQQREDPPAIQRVDKREAASSPDFSDRSFNPLRPKAGKLKQQSVTQTPQLTPKTFASLNAAKFTRQTVEPTLPAEDTQNVMRVEIETRHESLVSDSTEATGEQSPVPTSLSNEVKTIKEKTTENGITKANTTFKAVAKFGNDLEIAQEQPLDQPIAKVASNSMVLDRQSSSIRDSMSPQNYNYADVLVPATTQSTTSQIEQAWETHSSPQPFTGTLWWTQPARQSYRKGAVPLPIDLDSLLVRTLQHSAQIHVFSELPLIRDTAITEASANFDWHAFMEAMWNDSSDPVGNTLTTGGDPRFNDQKATTSAGLRRRNNLGGQTEIAQEFGHQNNNSNFFLPNDQATARLRLSYTHPLLRGGGRYYNQSLIVLAQVDSKVARDELERQIEGHLLEVTRAYWGLALERGTYLQRVRLYESSKTILDSLIARQGIDTYRSQIVRAQSAVSSREAALIRAEVAVRNAEARVRALVNDPEFLSERDIEIIPMDDPIDYQVTADMEEVLLVAMQNRSEVLQAFKQIKAAGVRKDMTKNELLPTLNLVMNSYLSGLRGNSDAGRAWIDQFSTGAPSYGVGFQMDMPVNNRAAKARHQRRRLELRQFESQLRLTMETVNLEVGIAVRETNASFREMQAKYRAMTAATEDSEYVKQRWELLPGDNQNASLVFDELLRTQDRLTTAENEFLKAQTTYNLSLTNIKKAAGMLLEAERISSGTTQECGTPQILFQKDSSGQDDTTDFSLTHPPSRQTVDGQPPTQPSSELYAEPEDGTPGFMAPGSQPTYQLDEQPTLDNVPQGPSLQGSSLPEDASSRRYPLFTK